MKIWLAKTEHGFAPTDEESERIHKRMGLGECAHFEIIRPRSLPMHRRYFGICSAIGNNQDPVRDESSIDYELRILAGHFEVLWIDGFEVRIPKRIAFHKLTHDEWIKLWPSLEMAIAERFGHEYLREIAA